MTPDEREILLLCEEVSLSGITPRQRVRALSLAQRPIGVAARELLDALVRLAEGPLSADDRDNFERHVAIVRGWTVGEVPTD